VKEIIEYGVVTTVPGTPAHVRGVINLRGCVVPVVDLSVKFGRPESPIGRRTCIVIVETEAFGDRTTTGVVADAVNQVIELAPDAIEAPPAFGTGIQLDYLAGIAKTDTRFVLVLNVDTVLSADARASVATARPAEASVEVPALA
jgi:purine-binding chemotaxis protein CheW